MHHSFGNNLWMNQATNYETPPTHQFSYDITTPTHNKQPQHNYPFYNNNYTFNTSCYYNNFKPQQPVFESYPFLSYKTTASPSFPPNEYQQTTKKFEENYKALNYYKENEFEKSESPSSNKSPPVDDFVLQHKFIEDKKDAVDVKVGGDE